jgi:hypothetical protein
LLRGGLQELLPGRQRVAARAGALLGLLGVALCEVLPAPLRQLEVGRAALLSGQALVVAEVLPALLIPGLEVAA